jgi:hypothetical protein
MKRVLAFLLSLALAGSAWAQIQTTNTAPINVSATATTQIIAPTGANRPIYITHIHYVTGAADNVQWEWSLVAGCSSGNTTLGGTENLGTNSVVSMGSGLGPVMIIPAGAYLCLVTSTSAQVGGWVAYQQ